MFLDTFQQTDGTGILDKIQLHPKIEVYQLACKLQYAVEKAAQETYKNVA